MNESTKNAVEGVRVLWSYLSPMEKITWCERLAPWLEVEDWWDVAPYVLNDDIDLSQLVG